MRGRTLRDGCAPGARRALSRVGRRQPRPKPGSGSRHRGGIGVVAMLVVAAVWLVSAASASAFSAHGSVEQVYVTRLAPNAQVSLLRSKQRNGLDADREPAGRLRCSGNVSPEAGYRVRLTASGEESGPVTSTPRLRRRGIPASSNRRSPPTADTGYITTRDGHSARDRHPPPVDAAPHHRGIRR